jgi:N utilization substance protein A
MNSELQAVLDYMERERGIDRGTLISAVKMCIMSAARKSVSPAKDLRIDVDPKTCDIKAYAQVTVVETVTEPHDQLTLAQARKIKADANLGDILDIETPPLNFGRIAAQMGKQAFLHYVRQAERDKIFAEFKDKPGEILSGTVRRFERNDVIMDVGRAEAKLSSRERVPTEEYQVGDRLRALLLSVDTTAAGTELVLSRSHPDFVVRLFQLEVSEIGDGTVEIKAIARDPGFRSKLAVVSHDDKVDPVGACVGMRGIRVKNIVRELSGEKIDIVRWSPDIKTFVTNALQPATLLRVDVDEASRTVSVTVPTDQLSQAIGKKGQNARLTSKLTGWRVDIHKDESRMDFGERVEKAIEDLAALEGFNRAWAEQLVGAGFASLDGIQEASEEDLVEAGFDAETAKAIREVVAKRSEQTQEQPPA